MSLEIFDTQMQAYVKPISLHVPCVPDVCNTAEYSFIYWKFINFLAVDSNVVYRYGNECRNKFSFIESINMIEADEIRSQVSDGRMMILFKLHDTDIDIDLDL